MDLLEALNIVNMVADGAALKDADGIDENTAISEVDRFIAKLREGRVTVDGQQLYCKNGVV